MCFSKTKFPTLFDNLGRPLDFSNQDQTLWNDKCDYTQLKDAYNYNKSNKNLIILQLNIRSILGKQDDLNRLLNSLSNQNSLPKVLIISETHLKYIKIKTFKYTKLQNFKP